MTSDAVPREQLAVARVARRQDAVEQIDAAGDALDEIVGHPGPHQISRLVGRQLRRGVADDVVHDVDRLTDAQAADRVALEADLDRGLRAGRAQSPDRSRPGRSRTAPVRAWRS